MQEALGSDGTAGLPNLNHAAYVANALTLSQYQDSFYINNINNHNLSESNNKSNLFQQQKKDLKEQREMQLLAEPKKHNI